MPESIISFSSLYWISYFLWIYSQISSNSSNVVFSIIILENLRRSLWIMRNKNNEKIETNNWTTLLIFDDKINFYFLNMFLYMTSVQSRSFELRIYAQTQDLQIFKKFNMSRMNPKEVFNNTAYSVQLPYIAGHSL